MARKKLKIGEVLTDTISTDYGELVPDTLAIVTEVYTKDNIVELLNLVIESRRHDTMFLGAIVKHIMVQNSSYGLIIIGDKRHVIRRMKTVKKDRLICRL